MQHSPHICSPQLSVSHLIVSLQPKSFPEAQAPSQSTGPAPEATTTHAEADTSSAGSGAAVLSAKSPAADVARCRQFEAYQQVSVREESLFDLLFGYRGAHCAGESQGMPCRPDTGAQPIPAPAPKPKSKMQVSRTHKHPLGHNHCPFASCQPHTWCF